MTIELKIFNEKQEDKIDFSLKLEKLLNGRVILIAVDEDGDRINCGSLLAITPEGKIELGVQISPEFGFQLDDKGSIKIEDKERSSSVDDHIRDMLFSKLNPFRRSRY